MNIKNRMDHLRGNHFIHVDDCIQYLPALTYLTLGSIGINSKHGFKERIVVAATAYTTMTALTNIGKYSFKEKDRIPMQGTRFPPGTPPLCLQEQN